MRLAILTTGRQDWGILRSTCMALRDDARFDVRLIVGGMHTSPAFGETETLIAEAGLEVAERLDWIAASDSAHAQAGAALGQVGDALARQRPDAVLLVADRFETAAAALAATLERIPIVHLHGGEETAGAFDNQLRHAITKLSHLHLVSHPEHAARVVALGEDPLTVHVVGAPGLDNLRRADLPDRRELEEDLGIPLVDPVVLVTLHPTTLGVAKQDASDGDERTGGALPPEVAAVVGAMDEIAATYVVTLPNNDPGHELVREAMRAAARSDRRVAVEALGDRRYWGLLRIADALLGNSSSALIEAPALRVPAVNVGDRQGHRVRGDNVIDARPELAAVAAALREALSPATRRRLAGTSGPFGDAYVAQRIVEVLAAWTPPNPPRKAPVRVPVVGS